MKKSISVILVAALMLFAFTACEQQVPNLLTKTPSAVIIEQTSDLFAGENVAATDFEVVVTYEDGTETTYPGANLIKYDSSKGTYSAEVGGITGVAYPAYSTYTGVVSLTPSEDLEIEKGSSAVNSVESVAVFSYVNHEGVEKTREKTYSTISYKIDDASYAAATAEVGDEVNVTASVSPVAGISKDFDFVATVVPADAQPTKADVTELVVTYNDTIKYGTTWANSLVTVSGRTADGETVTLKETTDYVFGNGVPEAKTISSLDPISFKVYFVAGDTGNKDVDPVTVSITVADQINTASVSLKYAGTVYAKEVTSIDTNLISATATYQGNTTQTTSDFTFYIDGSPEVNPTSAGSATFNSVQWICNATGQTGTANLSYTVSPARSE